MEPRAPRDTSAAQGQDSRGHSGVQRSRGQAQFQVGWGSSRPSSSVTPSSPSTVSPASPSIPSTPSRSAGSVSSLAQSVAHLHVGTSPARPPRLDLPRPYHAPRAPSSVTPFVQAIDTLDIPALPRPLRSAYLEELLESFDNPLVRALLATTTKDDKNEQLGHREIVHSWYRLNPGQRGAIVARIKQDLFNLARLLDRLTDTSTSIFIAEPEIPPGHSYLDPDGDEMTTHIYTPRSVLIGPHYLMISFKLMEEVWRHGVAVHHVAGFLARKQHLMVKDSQYRGQPLPTLVNHLPVREFIVGPSIVDSATQQPWDPVGQRAAMLRSEERRSHIKRKGVPLLPNFSAAVDALAVQGELRPMIKRVVLDTSASCRPFEDFLLIFRKQFDLTRGDAAHLAMLAADDADAVGWPL